MGKIKIGSVNYEVISEQKIEGFSTRVEIALRRPNGKRTYHAVRYEDGSISEVV